MNNPTCSECGHVFPWRRALSQVLGLRRRGKVLWGASCPACGAELRVPTARVLLIAFAGVFFGSQTSTLLVLTDLDPFSALLVRLWLIVGFYAIAVFAFLKLEPVK